MVKQISGVKAAHAELSNTAELVGASLEVKLILMKAVLGADPLESEPRWKALLHIVQMLMAAPTKRHKAEGMKTQAAVLERRIQWANQEGWEALL